MREIISVEVGGKSRWTGNHFYNSLQTAIDQGVRDLSSGQLDNVFYTSGSDEGRTLVPRLVSITLKGSGGKSAAAASATARSFESTGTWTGKLQNLTDHDQDDEENEFLKSLDETTAADQSHQSYSDHLTKTACYWSDFNAAYYHPKSMLETHDYVYGDDRNHFSYFQQGLAVMDNADFEAEVMDDRIRNFMEECDSAQGFHILADADDGFSGLTSSLVEELCQEYAKKSIMVYSLSASTSIASKVAQANQALLMKSMQDSQVLYVPVHLPDTKDLDATTWSRTLSSQFDTLYHQTGYLASAIYGLAAPLHKGREMGQYQNILGYGSESTCALSLGFPPFPQTFTTELPGPVLYPSLGGVVEWARDLTLESCFNIRDTTSSFSVFSGITHTLNGQILPQHKTHLLDTVVAESITKSLSALSPSAQWFNNTNPFPLGPSFPQLFSPLQRTRTGLLHESIDQDTITSMPTVTTLSTGACLEKVYKKMAEALTLKSVRHDFGQGEFGMDGLEFEDTREHFLNLVHDGDE